MLQNFILNHNACFNHAKPFLSTDRKISTRSRLNAVVGIDLGTTNSSIAYVGPNGPQVIPDADGNSIFPSIVTITEDDELFVGPAAATVDAGPANTFYSFKRLMGQKVSELSPMLISTLLYTIAEGDRGECLVYSAGADEMLTPSDLSSFLLQYMRQTAEFYMKETISGAVITVPVHFSHSQRTATLEAAQLARLGTVHLLQEPVAAALAYGINGGIDGDTILVFDLGGGTFDVSILQAFEGIIEVLGTHGDARLGGDDIDVLIADWIYQQYSSGDGDNETAEEIQVDKGAVLKAARAAKEGLALSDRVEITLPGSNKKIELTQETFELITEEMFLRMADVLASIGQELFVEWAVRHPREAVNRHDKEHQRDVPNDTSKSSEPSSSDNSSDNSNINNNDEKNGSDSGNRWIPPPRRITQIALVGQVTRLPSIRSFIKRVTGIEPCTSVDPGEAVALGAATHAGILIGTVGQVELMDGSFVADLHNRTTGFRDWQP